MQHKGKLLMQKTLNQDGACYANFKDMIEENKDMVSVFRSAEPQHLLTLLAPAFSFLGRHEKNEKVSASMILKPRNFRRNFHFQITTKAQTSLYQPTI